MEELTNDPMVLEEYKEIILKEIEYDSNYKERTKVVTGSFGHQPDDVDIQGSKKYTKLLLTYLIQYMEESTMYYTEWYEELEIIEDDLTTKSIYVENINHGYNIVLSNPNEAGFSQVSAYRPLGVSSRVKSERGDIETMVIDANLMQMIFNYADVVCGRKIHINNKISDIEFITKKAVVRLRGKKINNILKNE